MTALCLTWTVAANLTMLLIVAGAFTVATNRFESVVLSALAMIYVAVNMSATIMVRRAVERGQGLAGMIASLAEHLKHPEMEEVHQTLRRAESDYRQTTSRFYINATFTFIVWALAVSNIVVALL